MSCYIDIWLALSTIKGMEHFIYDKILVYLLLIVYGVILAFIKTMLIKEGVMALNIIGVVVFLYAGRVFMLDMV